jgi:hypothetical protein
VTRLKRFREHWESGELIRIAEGVTGAGDIGIVCGRVEHPAGKYRTSFNVLFSEGYRIIHFTNMQEVKDGSTS